MMNKPLFEGPNLRLTAINPDTDATLGSALDAGPGLCRKLAEFLWPAHDAA